MLPTRFLRSTRVRANLQAHSIVVQGRVEGDIHGFNRTELKRSAIVVGEIHTPHIVIEDGASLERTVQVHQDISRQTKKKDVANAK